MVDDTFLGRSWSLFPPGVGGGMNLVRGADTIVADIFAIALLRPGEDAIHPDLGIAPDLFANKGEPIPLYYEHALREALLRYLRGKVASFGVRASKPPVRNKIDFEIWFVPARAASRHTLTFGFYVYPDLKVESPVLDGRNWDRYVAGDVGYLAGATK